jgi:hypothetical protein
VLHGTLAQLSTTRWHVTTFVGLSLRGLWASQGVMQELLRLLIALGTTRVVRAQSQTLHVQGRSHVGQMRSDADHRLARCTSSCLHWWCHAMRQIADVSEGPPEEPARARRGFMSGQAPIRGRRVRCKRPQGPCRSGRGLHARWATLPARRRQSGFYLHLFACVLGRFSLRGLGPVL